MMLFSGMACFSPSVPTHTRKAWVTNGGTLTHTEADFYRANYFFCSGTEDPWLSELLSRSLIVRHASWVLECTSQQFIVPTAPYTLDDGFDISKIRLIHDDDSLQTTFKCSRKAIETKQELSFPELLPAGRNPRKRARDSETNYSPRRINYPSKKSRIGENHFPERRAPKVEESPQDVIPLLPNASKSKSVPNPLTEYSAHRASVTVKHSRPILLKPTPRTSLLSDDSHQELALKFQARAKASPSSPLRISIDELLRAPQTNARQFVVNHTYLGRTFTCEIPAPSMVSKKQS